MAGSLGAAALHSLPPPAWLPLLLLFGLILLIVRRLRWVAVMLLAACSTLWQFQHRLEDRLRPDLAGAVVSVSGLIASIPQDIGDGLRFRFRPDRDDREGPYQLPQTLLVNWYTPEAPVEAGQRWALTLLLKPPWGAVNFAGPDRERWLFATGIGGLGTVRSGRLLNPASAGGARLAAARERIHDAIARTVESPRAAAVLQALAIADRSGLEPSDRRVLAATGTAHLLAISGLHVGMAATSGLLLTRALAWGLPLLLPARALTLLGLAGGALFASAYTALADFGVATLRALLMLLVVLMAVAATRRIQPGQAWLLALAGVLLTDPFAPLGAGFWFSFVAVGALLWVFTPRPAHPSAFASLLLAQAAVLLALLPFSASWYQAASWPGFIANLIAIPLVSFLLVPLVLAGVMALGLSSALAGLVWSLAGVVAAALLGFLDALAQLPGALHPLAAPGDTGVLLGLLGALLLLTPAGLPLRWIGLFLLLPLFLRSPPPASDERLELEVLDVGQGTAVLLLSAGRSLLYDSGPGDGEDRDLVSSVIIPAIRRQGMDAPDRVVISHGDLDHAGGLGSIRRRFPRTLLHANLPGGAAVADACATPLEWRWGKTGFRVRHPSRSLPYLGNDSSCVLEITHGRRRLLLAGDISSAIEERLLGAGLAPVDLLLVPHHGSLTSSSTAFVTALQPGIAVATAALGNRFGFPRPQVRMRYDRLGSRFLSTGSCGAMRLTIGGDGILRISSARLARPAPWRWPAEPGCPANEVFSVSFDHPDNTLQSTE